MAEFQSSLAELARSKDAALRDRAGQGTGTP
jgi:hypothetical protein